MENIKSYIIFGFIGSLLFSSIFSLQWIILNTRPVLMAYIPPMSVGFLTGVVICIFKIRWENEAVSKEQDRMKAIRETAGAVCHETNQPLQVIISNLEIMLMDLNDGTKMHSDLTAVLRQVERIAEITRKLHAINKYKTKPYLSGRIIDIDESSSK